MSTTTMTAQEIERITVARMSSFQVPVFDPPAGIVAYGVNPGTAASVELTTLEQGIHLIRKHGAIVYAVAEVPDENGEETYWTVQRLQNLFDHHRMHYVNGDEC